LKYKKIAIIRLSALGDIIHTLPAFTLLREAFPHSKISWIVEPVGAKLLENFQGIDEIFILDLRKKGIFYKLKQVRKIRSMVRKGKTFDLVLDFQGLLKSAILAWLLKGKVSIGFHKKNLREPLSRFFYKQTVDFFEETNHVALKNLHLARLGSQVSTSSIWDSDRKKINWYRLNIKWGDLTPWEKGVKQFLSQHQLEMGNFLIVNIGGGWESKLMHIHQYIKIINGIKKKYKTVILWGNEKEKKVAEEISEKTGTVMSDFFNFSELILFITYSRLIVTGDTLALHLADLVKTPTVGIFGPTSPSRNGSLMEESISIYKKLPCSFCYKKKCGTIECIQKINIEKIIESVETLYERYN
jgi:lipopolysaccharide heptosyltransferase I